MRLDLLALTDDDLAALSNRGTVKRARQEAESLTAALSEGDEGTVTARWSDEIECVLPTGKPLSQARCTCPAEPPCRHVIRTVMAYSLRNVPTIQERVEPVPAGELAPDKGIQDESRKLFEAGQLFELVRSEKPTARCHSLGIVTRFLVPGDPNFTVCDCGQPAPCAHAWLALWAFERLPKNQTAGLVDTRSTPYPVPTETLAAIAPSLAELLLIGLASAPTALWDRLGRGEETLRKVGLVWPAECLAELPVLRAAYLARDARFDPAELVAVVGELLLRLATIQANRGVIPAVFVRGAASDRALEIASGKLIGLGCQGKVRREGIRLTAFLQNEDTGQVIAVPRDFKNDGRAFSALAQTGVAKGITLATVAAGRTLVRGGKRSPGGIFSFGRAPAALHPQTFAWEKLRAPVLAESFAEVQAHLSALPPTPLRPRRLGESFHVIPLTEVVSAGFDTLTQCVVAELRDAQGATAWLQHPYYASGAEGCDALLLALSSSTVRFVSGGCRLGPRGIVLQPASLIVEENGVRRAVQPWLDSASGQTRSLPTLPPREALSPARFLTDELTEALGGILLTGLEALTERERRRWRELARQAEALGFFRLPLLLDQLATGSDHALQTLLQLAALAPDTVHSSRADL